MCFDADPIPTEPAEVAQLMDEHHLVVLGGSPEHRAHFALELEEQLEAWPETEVIRLARVTTLEELCRQLERQLDTGSRVPRTVAGIATLLRVAPTDQRHQFIVWRDADRLLDEDVTLFGRIVNACFVAAAEREHVDPDALLLQRFAFVGGDRLGAYAEDAAGQFQRWQDDSGVVAAWLERPPVLTYRLDG
ncbi:MAG: hypothetical protein HKO59_17205 [Phycisphaerales bacterium]|nr:hypothetical protein [Phycisphaerae bacterium]NNF42256.1 hypothetical protein [Phycisphaerales bacterium]NNM27689.1 hypothetical protein [Phycisphaerales bacterium]